MGVSLHQQKNQTQMRITNKIFAIEKEIQINDIVYPYNYDKHIVDSFTKTAIRFRCERTGKLQIINRNTFLKKHFYTKDGYWMMEQKGRTVNLDYL